MFFVDEIEYLVSFGNFFWSTYVILACNLLITSHVRIFKAQDQKALLIDELIKWQVRISKDENVEMCGVNRIDEIRNQ